MIVGMFMYGRWYGLEDYVMCVLFVIGIMMFIMGDVDLFLNFNYCGVTYIIIALFTESTAGDFEEWCFFNIF